MQFRPQRLPCLAKWSWWEVDFNLCYRKWTMTDHPHCTLAHIFNCCQKKKPNSDTTDLSNVFVRSVVWARIKENKSRFPCPVPNYVIVLLLKSVLTTTVPFACHKIIWIPSPKAHSLVRLMNTFVIFFTAPLPQTSSKMHLKCLAL